MELNSHHIHCFHDLFHGKARPRAPCHVHLMDGHHKFDQLSIINYQLSIINYLMDIISLINYKVDDNIRGATYISDAVFKAALSK